MESKTSQPPNCVLVTGGSGFVGSHIVQQLLHSDPTITVAILSRTPKKLGIFDGRVTYHSADIASPSQVQSVFDKLHPIAVIHAATPSSVLPALIHNKTNIIGTNTLLDTAKKCKETRAFIYTSSDSALIPTQTPLTEADAQLHTATTFNNPYGRSKALADAAVQAANCSDLATAVLRLPCVYGERAHNLVPQLLSSLRQSQHKMQLGSNEKVFEFVYAGKAGEAHVLAMRALLAPNDNPGVAGEAFHISDGVPEPFWDFARRCYAAAGSPVAAEEMTVIPFAAVQVMASVGEWVYWVFTLGRKTPEMRRVSIDYLGGGCCWNIGKAREKLGYVPVGDQDGAIRRSVEWAMENANV